MIWELRHEFKVGLLIEIAGIPRSTYYYHAGQFEKPDKYAEIKEKIRRIYDESKGRYGYRRITAELRKTHKINHKTVQKLMRKMGIFCRVRMKNTGLTGEKSEKSLQTCLSVILRLKNQIRNG